MRSIFLAVFVCSIALGVQAQISPDVKQQIDSLKLRLTETLSDFERAGTLALLAEQYIDFNDDSSTLLIQNAVDLCSRPEQDTAVVNLYLHYAQALQQKRKHDQRYGYLLKAKHATRSLTAPSSYHRRVFSDLSDYYYRLQHGDSALYYDLAVLDNSIDTLDVIVALKRVGVTYNNIGNTVKALENYLSALRLLDKYNHPAQKAGLLNNTGVLYEDDGDNERAEKYYTEALAIFRELKNPRQIAMVLSNLGIVYDHDDKPEKALTCFAEAEEVRAQNNLPPSYPLHLNIGNSLMHAGRPAEAIKHFNQAMEGFKANDDNYGVSLAYRHIGEALYDLGQYSEAEKTLRLAITRATEQGDGEIIQQAHFDLSRVYAKTGQYKKAYEHEHAYAQMQDSLSSRNRRSKLGLLEKEYELAHKENENSMLARENEINKIQAAADRTTSIALGTALVLLIFLVGVVTTSYRRTKSRNAELSKQKSEIEQANILISQQAQQLREASEAKMKFFANVSHELRTPVTLLNGMLEMMRDGSRKEKSNRQLEIALASSGRLQSLVGEVLDLSRPGVDQPTVKKKNIAVFPLISRIVYSFESLLVKKNIKLELEVSTFGDVQVPLDEEKFEKIVNNLMYNAVKFNRDGGWIKVEGMVSPENDKAVIIISDSGVGIPERDQPHVFERFYQSNATLTKNAQGLGIGLSLVKELMHLHGGDVTLESRPNEGSVFTLWFPLADKGVVVEEENKEFLTEPTPFVFDTYDKPPRILVVEDNKEMRYYLKEVLGAGITIHEAAHGREALKWLKTNIPDLILSDVMMPEMDGHEFLQALKSDNALRKIPVIMLTARASEEDLLQGLRLGVDDYIVKPFNAMELKTRIHNLLSNQNIRRQWADKPVETDELPATPSSGEIFIAKVQELVERRTADVSLGVLDLAEHLALSERQLYRIAGSLTGMTPAQLIKEIRLRIAHRLLIEKKVTKITTLASDVGFENSGYFSKQFLLRFGKRPAEFL